MRAHHLKRLFSREETLSLRIIVHTAGSYTALIHRARGTLRPATKAAKRRCCSYNPSRHTYYRHHRIGTLFLAFLVDAATTFSVLNGKHISLHSALTTEMAKVLSKREAKSKNPLSHLLFPTLHESCTPPAKSSALSPPAPPPPSVGRMRVTTATPPSMPRGVPSSPQGLSRPEITSS